MTRLVALLIFIGLFTNCAAPPEKKTKDDPEKSKKSEASKVEYTKEALAPHNLAILDTWAGMILPDDLLEAGKTSGDKRGGVMAQKSLYGIEENSRLLEAFSTTSAYRGKLKTQANNLLKQLMHLPDSEYIQIDIPGGIIHCSEWFATDGSDEYILEFFVRDTYHYTWVKYKCDGTSYDCSGEGWKIVKSFRLLDPQ